MKACVDCRHFHREGHSLCLRKGRPVVGHHPVSGLPILKEAPSPYMERNGPLILPVFLTGLCGPKGRFWAPKEKR